VLILLGLTLLPLHAQTGSEYEVKAAFLYKFASFVKWPEEVPKAPIGICVIGQDPFGGALDRVVKGKIINGAEFLIRRLKPSEPTGDCHMLFISASERKRLKPVLDRVQREKILTVGDVPGFCEHGGVVNFDVADNHVQLEINLKAAERAGLQLSSRLLSLARIVRDPGPGGQ
jgi:hypothetical protein